MFCIIKSFQVDSWVIAKECGDVFRTKFSPVNHLSSIYHFEDVSLKT